MRRRARPVLALLSVIGSVGCAPPAIEAELVEITKGSEPAIKVSVKGKPGTFLRCTAENAVCPDDAITKSGPAMIVIKLDPIHPAPQKIVIESYSSNTRKGKHGEAVIDFSKKPQLIDGSSDLSSSFKCLGRKCDGIVQWGPHERVTVTSEPGAVLEIAGTKLTADSSGLIVGDVKNLAGKPFGDLPLDQTFVGEDKTEHGTFPVAMTFADGAKLTAALRLTTGMGKYAIESFFKDITKGPLLLPGEAASKLPAGAHSAYFLDAHKLLGRPAHSLRDIDILVVEADSTTRSTTCKYESGATASLTSHDVEVKLYERRTGHVMATKKLTASDHCDDTVTHKVNEAMPAQNNYVASSTIEAWVTTQLGH